MGKPYIGAAASLGKVPKVPNGAHMMSGGSRVYIQDGLKHRENGPAEIRRDGYRAWFWRGVKHRKGKPAVYHPDGTVEYWENGKFLRREKTG